jgi:hypothetical protein
MRSLTLLIQLFGREVMDRLAAAGFDSGRSIARAGAERLAEEGGLALTLARRILAVAIESEMSADDAVSFEDLAPPATPEPTAPARPAERASSARVRPRRNARPPGDAPAAAKDNEGGTQAPSETAVHVRRPLRRPTSPLATGRPAPVAAAGADPDAAAVPPAGAARPAAVTAEPAAALAEPAAASAEPAVMLAEPAAGAPAPAPGSAEPPAGAAGESPGAPAAEAGPARRRAARPLDADPFVDDVGLISWMGLKSRGEGGSPFTVADGILDPPRRGRSKRSPAGEAPTLRPEPEAARGTPAARADADPAPVPPSVPVNAPGSPGVHPEAPSIPAAAPGVGRAEESALAAPRRVRAPERQPPDVRPPSLRGAAASTARRPHTLAGSFWCFGEPAAPGGAAPDDRDHRGDDPPDDPDVPNRTVLPRRRAHDEQ